MAVGIEAGDHGSRTQFIKSMFIPTSDQRLVENVTAVMLAAPPHIAAAAIRGALEFDCQAAAALCKAPALHLAAIPAAHAATVDNGAAAEPHQRLHRRCRHFNQLEVPDRRMR